MPMVDELPTIHALWIGDELGAIAAACLQSFATQGHKMVLHCYQPIRDIPDGVTVSDANAILPEKSIFQHTKSGSYALFSDLFRYEVLTKHSGIYIDCDVFCIAPLKVPEHGYLFGYESDNQLNGAVLAAPSNSEFLASLLHIARDPIFIPPWTSRSRQRKLKLRKALGFPVRRENMKWGMLGPAAVTYYANACGILKFAQPIDAFYPLDCRRTIQLLDPNLSIEDLITTRSSCIHLYNEMFKKHDLSSIPATSPVGRMLRYCTVQK